MATEQLERAKALLKAKRYGEARVILEKLWGDPTAERWLGKLNELDPPEEMPDFGMAYAVPRSESPTPQSAAERGSDDTLKTLRAILDTLEQDSSSVKLADLDRIYYQGPALTIYRKLIQVGPIYYSVKHLTSTAISEVSPARPLDAFMHGLAGGAIGLLLGFLPAMILQVPQLMLIGALIGVVLGALHGYRRGYSNYYVTMTWSNGQRQIIQAAGRDDASRVQQGIARTMKENQ